jgi:hypothetical protein
MGTFGITLRKRALEALEQSTRMLNVASTLLTQGNRSEATRLLRNARRQRRISTLLLAEANRLENSAVPNPPKKYRERANFRTQFHNTAATH